MHNIQVLLWTQNITLAVTPLATKQKARHSNLNHKLLSMNKNQKLLLTFISLENILDVCEDFIGRLAGIHRAVEPPDLVVVHQGGGEAVVLLQSLLQHLSIVIVPFDKNFPSDIILARHSGWACLPTPFHAKK